MSKWYVPDHVKLANILPPAFISCVIAIIWSTYAGLHLVPLLQSRTAPECFDVRVVFSKPIDCRGVWQTVVSQLLTALLLVCYMRSVVAQPGSVPVDKTWKLGNRDGPPRVTSELKESGDRRHCKWCFTYKPDRCHHCRICGICVLRMDHHCPWIMNCIGFKNHKYFFLLVVYAVLNCVFTAITMIESVYRAVYEEETVPTDRFLMVFGLTLAIIMGLIMGLFISFHIWLMMNGMTTIEFCEKTTTNAAKSKQGASYDAGFYANIANVLGPRPLLWLVPASLPAGDGVSYFRKPAHDEI